jgi:hypothetical protein
MSKGRKNPKQLGPTYRLNMHHKLISVSYKNIKAQLSHMMFWSHLPSGFCHPPIIERMWQIAKQNGF